jgi:hypothetical protein
MVCAVALIKKGLQVDLLLSEEPAESQAGVFRLSPYELPVVGLGHRDYGGELFSFLEMKELRRYFLSDKDFINVVFGPNRIDFSSKTIIEDISRIFPEYEANVKSFIAEVIKIEKELPILWEKSSLLHGSVKQTLLGKTKRFFSFGLNARRDISYLYNKHKLPPYIRLIFNSVLFVVSGTYTQNLPLIEAVRVIAMALEGVNSSEADAHSFASSMLDSLRGYVKITSLQSLSSADIKNVDFVKKDFVSNFNHFGSLYSSCVRYPMSMFFKLDAENIPEAMSRCLIYVKIDDSGFYSVDDVYVVRYMFEGRSAYLRITSFIPYGLFDIDSEGHREKLSVMKHIVEELVPALTVSEYDCYPDHESSGLKKDLDKIFANLVENDLVYGNIYEELESHKLSRKTVFCGRECFYPLGFESSVISGLSSADKFFRGLKS